MTHEFNTQAEAIAEIKRYYEVGHEYLSGILDGVEFKIRMNKDHARNSKRNDDQFMHNLSLVNCNCPEARVTRRTMGGKLQMQRDNILSWEDALYEIEEFLFEIAE